MLGSIPRPILAEAGRRAGAGKALAYDHFNVNINPSDSSIGLGSDGKTYVKIPMPADRKGGQHFEPGILSHATTWTRYNRETAPDLYKFFDDGQTPITDFYMIRITTTKGSCIAVY